MKKIEISIAPNYFAPKCKDRDENFDINNSHAVAHTKCNFRCKFCRYGVDDSIVPEYMTLDEYTKTVDDLLKKSKMFKFTGGEPTMNPYLKELVKIVKDKGGIVFLDSNCSMKNIIMDLIDDKLIDVLGVSLKGLNSKAAMITSGVKSSKLCWDNPLETINYSSKNGVRTIVTYVAYDNFNYEDIINFSKLIDNDFHNVYLKINNLCGKLHRDSLIKPVDKDNLILNVKRFINENPIWEGRVILINGHDAVTDYNKIDFY